MKSIYDLLGPRGYELLYHQHLASAEADVADWYDRVDELGLPRTGRLLDVGCGLGERTAAWSARGYGVTGIDLSSSLVIEAKRRFPELSFLIKDASCVSDLGSFELIVAHFNFLMMLPTDKVVAILKGLRPCVAPNGVFLTDVCRPRIAIPAFREGWMVDDKVFVDVGKPTDDGFLHTWFERDGNIALAEERFLVRTREEYEHLAQSTGWKLRCLDWKADDQLDYDLMVFEPRS